MCNGAAPGAVPIIFFCLKDGGQTFYHSTGIQARPMDAVRDKRLRSVLEHHKLAMCKAYTFMQVKQMDMNNRIFETMIKRVMTENMGLTMRKVGEPCIHYFEMSSLIYDARNKIARAAIKEKCERVLWLDSDMQFEPDLMERLSARIDEGREFVTGLYVSRKEPIRPTIYRNLEIRETEEGRKASAPAYIDYPRDSVFEVDACGFGIVMTTVRLLKDVTGSYGLPFTPVQGFGEDMAFCIRTKELGYPLWCDSSIQAGHIGLTTYKPEDSTRYPTACEEFKSY